jgi:hypothetical protein
MQTDAEASSPLKLDPFGQFTFSSTNFSGVLEYKDCTAVGVALFTGYPPDESRGLGGATIQSQIQFVLIEPGSTLQKSLMSAVYFTNIFASASTHETDITRPFLGTWKSYKESQEKDLSLEITPDHSFKCTWNGQTTTGKFWVAQGAKDYYKEMVLLKDGKAWTSGTIRSDGSLNLSASGDGPSSQIRH